MEIIKATEAHGQDIVSCVLESYVDGTNISAAYRKDIALVRDRLQNGAASLVAVDAGQAVIGTICIVLDPQHRLAEFASERACDLRMLAVSVAARRQGVGSALVTAAESLAAAHGKSELWACTVSDFVAAQSLYRHLGYVRRPERDHTDARDGVKIIAFSRSLGLLSDARLSQPAGLGIGSEE